MRVCLKRLVGFVVLGVLVAGVGLGVPLFGVVTQQMGVSVSERWVFPVVIHNPLNISLTNFTVVLTFNSSNFDWWGQLGEYVGFFYDLNASEPMQYYVSYYNRSAEELDVLLLVRDIPPGGNLTVYLVSSNSPLSGGVVLLPYLYYDDFVSESTLGVNWTNYYLGLGYYDENYTFGVDAYVNSGALVLNHTFVNTGGEADLDSRFALNGSSVETWLSSGSYYLIDAVVRWPGGGSYWPCMVYVRDGPEVVGWVGVYRYSLGWFSYDYWVGGNRTAGGSVSASVFSSAYAGDYVFLRFYLGDSGLYVEGYDLTQGVQLFTWQQLLSYSDFNFSREFHIGFSQIGTAGGVNTCYVYWVRVVKVPATSIGFSVLSPVVVLRFG